MPRARNTPARMKPAQEQPAISAHAAWLAGLTPLQVRCRGTWNPATHPWGTAAREKWVGPILEHGPRPLFEMEQVIPGEDPDDPDTDPILDAVELHESGQTDEARRLLLKVAERDPRCIDAHAHLGHLLFDHDVPQALAHYTTGVEIGKQALGPQFDGVLSWNLLDNRPFLRCLHGYIQCLWRLDRFEEAERAITEMLWLNPTDNLGARLDLPRVRTREPWPDDED